MFHDDLTVRRQRGMTLIELMITVLVMLIVLMFAAPPFGGPRQWLQQPLPTFRLFAMTRWSAHGGGSACRPRAGGPGARRPLLVGRGTARVCRRA
ncbi:type II secretion system protein [uncultured Thiodictyon sp.]|jgi:prepilin-type N-terminal cleavage/methylation domain-containing protein|uniref:pilus assembly FimT family protein n=1 Tax=uncultured Thiodictyon sp. TaxID=1846217 RepID=UPI00345A62B2